MKNIFSLCLVLALFAACQSTKSPNSNSNMEPTPVNPDMKGNLLDGSWVANYIMNSPKALPELFPNGSPSITFNSVNGNITGLAGCNNFNGTYTTDGSKLKIGENIAVTRKMCPDMTGEQLFLETLKKINTYSVTEQGKTLNLIMGDMAIMRMTRKPMQ